MTKRAAAAVLLVLIWIVTACSTATQSSGDLDYPLAAIDQSVSEALSMGIRGFSENRREIYSKPFQVRQSDEARAKGFRERGTAKVLVLGSERPYNVEVQVSIERGRVARNLNDIKYSHDHYDKSLAKQLLDDILTNLRKKMRNQNMIDDIKAF
jgi:hypothetical protein